MGRGDRVALMVRRDTYEELKKLRHPGQSMGGLIEELLSMRPCPHGRDEA